MRPLRKVPVVMTTAPACTMRLSRRFTPMILLGLSDSLLSHPSLCEGWGTRDSSSAREANTTSATSACLMNRFGCDSSISRIFMRYCCLSHCARGDHTAGPREVLSRRNWMPTASATSPMMPPKASTSRTRWPLAMPPMAGLQDICAMRSRLSVNRAVRRPIRAAAMAASQPACPAPTTSTSYCSVKGIPFSILPGLADSLAQQMKNPTLSHTARQDGAPFSWLLWFVLELEADCQLQLTDVVGEVAVVRGRDLSEGH